MEIQFCHFSTRSFIVLLFLASLLNVPTVSEARGSVFGDVLDWIIDVAQDLELSVYPGTHYCGLQSSKEKREPESELDHCCYYHDQCSKYAIWAHTTKYGILNSHSYPIHPCECNERFVKCLHQIDSVNAGVVANLYYDLVGECIERNSTSGDYCCLVQQTIPPI